MFPSRLREVSLLSVCQRTPSDYTTKIQNIFDLRKYYSNKIPPFSLNYVKLGLPKNTTFSEKMNNHIVRKISTRKRYHGHRFSGILRLNSDTTPIFPPQAKICTFADDNKGLPPGCPSCITLKPFIYYVKR